MPSLLWITIVNRTVYGSMDLLWSARCPPKAQKCTNWELGREKLQSCWEKILDMPHGELVYVLRSKKMTLHFFPQSMLDPCSIFVLAVFHCIWTHFQWQWRQYDHYLTNHHGDRWNDGMAIKWDWGRWWIVMRYDVQCVIWCQSNAMNGTPCWPRVS